VKSEHLRDSKKEERGDSALGETHARLGNFGRGIPQRDDAPERGLD